MHIQTMKFWKEGCMKRKPRKKISYIKKILTDHKIKISKLAEKLLLLGIKRIALINGYTLFKPTFSRCFNTISIISLFVLLSITSAEAQNARHMFNPKIDTLFVASEPDYPPFCIVDEKGNADGFSVDLIKVVAEVMHLHVQVKVGPWAEIKQELVEGKIDALPLVGRSPEREEVYDFTFPYHTMNGAVFVRNGTKDIKTLNDMKQKDIVVMKEDNAHEFVKRVKLSDKIHSTETYNIAFQELSEGKYDAVIAQKLLGLQLLNDMNINNVKALDVILTDFNQDFSFAVQEGDRELLSILNEGLSIIIANGTYNELHKKWWTPIDLLQEVDLLKKNLSMILPLHYQHYFYYNHYCYNNFEITSKEENPQSCEGNNRTEKCGRKFKEQP